MSATDAESFLKIFNLGPAIWNRLLLGTGPEEVLNKPSHEQPFNATEKQKIKNTLGLEELPDLNEANFAGLVFERSLNFVNYKFKNVSFENCIFEQDVNFRSSHFDGHVNFKNARFKKVSSFSEAAFLTSVCFKKTVFENDCTFSSAKFSKAYFLGVRFLGSAKFSNCLFEHGHFRKTIFGGRAWFTETGFAKASSIFGVEFLELVDFINSTISNTFRIRRCKFHRGVFFDKLNVLNDGLFEVMAAEFVNGFTSRFSRFRGTVFFEKSIFTLGPIFDNSAFEHSVIFTECHLMRSASFNKAIFSKSSAFKNCKLHAINFSDVKFEGHTTFFQSVFIDAPTFHGCTLHSDTTFFMSRYEYEKIADPAEKGARARIWDERARAWQALKLKMNALHAYDEEHEFFTREMNARAEAGSTPQKFLVRLYRITSDYGRSLWRPIAALISVYLLVLSFNVFLSLPSGAWAESEGSAHNLIGKVMAFSAVSSIPLMGQTRIASDLVDSLFGPNTKAMVYFLSVVQGLISTALVFLIGLGLRNRFKIK